MWAIMMNLGLCHVSCNLSTFPFSLFWTQAREEDPAARFRFPVIPKPICRHPGWFSTGEIVWYRLWNHVEMRQGDRYDLLRRFYALLIGRNCHQCTPLHISRWSCFESHLVEGRKECQQYPARDTLARSYERKSCVMFCKLFRSNPFGPVSCW